MKKNMYLKNEINEIEKKCLLLYQKYIRSSQFIFLTQNRCFHFYKMDGEVLDIKETNSCRNMVDSIMGEDIKLNIDNQLHLNFF